jgi:hypothetical protein
VKNIRAVGYLSTVICPPGKKLSQLVHLLSKEYFGMFFSIIHILHLRVRSSRQEELSVAMRARGSGLSYGLKGTHARDFTVRFSHFFGIIQ